MSYRKEVKIIYEYADKEAQEHKRWHIIRASIDGYMGEHEAALG